MPESPLVNETLLKALAVTAEICDRPLSDAAAVVMCADLSRYDLEQVLGALDRCRKEVQGKLTLNAILIRLADGRPSADEAWAMLPKDEQESAVLTQETLSAMNPAMQLYNEGDEVGARMAFRDTYTRLVQQARDTGKPVLWMPSLGFDKAGRAGVIAEAVEQGRLPVHQAEAILGQGRLMDALGTDAEGLKRLADLKRGLLKLQ